MINIQVGIQVLHIALSKVTSPYSTQALQRSSTPAVQRSSCSDECMYNVRLSFLFLLFLLFSFFFFFNSSVDGFFFYALLLFIDSLFCSADIHALRITSCLRSLLWYFLWFVWLIFSSSSFYLCLSAVACGSGGCCVRSIKDRWVCDAFSIRYAYLRGDYLRSKNNVSAQEQWRRGSQAQQCNLERGNLSSFEPPVRGWGGALVGGGV